MSTETLYVVRTTRTGKFVRAFLFEDQAKRWAESSRGRWKYAAEIKAVGADHAIHA